MTGLGQSRTWSVAATSAARSSRHATGPPIAALGLLGQVVARRERPPGALEDDDPDRRVGGGGVDRGDERRDELARQRVELGRAVERQPDAPRRRVPEEDRLGGSAGRQPASGGSSRTTSASTAIAPAGRRDDRVEVDLEHVRALHRRGDRGRRASRRRAARSTAGRPRTAVEDARRRAGRRASPRAAAASIGASRIATSSRTSARTPPSPTRTAGPNCGSRRRPTISSTPGRAPSARPAARGPPARVAGRSRAASGAARVDRVVAAQPERDAADIALVGEPDRIELERDRAADRAAPPATAAAASVDRDRLGHRDPGRAEQRQALALGQRGRRPGVGGRLRCRVRAVRRPVRGERRPAGTPRAALDRRRS